MPEIGRYAKRPRPESVRAMERALETHTAVAGVERINDHTLLIQRTGNRPSVRMYLTNIYTLGAADVDEILAEDPAANLIVSVSLWNSFTGSAKATAAERGVGLFKFGEALGAINYVGARFLKYTLPDSNDKQRKRAG